eukprot:6207876-Pleurochrysis_carterae.AAC.2
MLAFGQGFGVCFGACSCTREGRFSCSLSAVEVAEYVVAEGRDEVAPAVVHVCKRACKCARARVRACVGVCVRACVPAYVRASTVRKGASAWLWMLRARGRRDRAHNSEWLLAHCHLPRPVRRSKTRALCTPAKLKRDAPHRNRCARVQRLHVARA